MLKWTVIVIGLAAIVIATGLSGIGWDMLQPAVEPAPEPSVDEVYGDLKHELFNSCIDRLKQRGLVDETKNRPQAEWACGCFADEIHAQFGSWKVAEFKAQMQQGKANDRANELFIRCTYAAGLN